MRDLLRDPACRAQDLGQLLPDHPHAASVAMPLWSHVERYEQGDPELVAALPQGYPRFLTHGLIKRLQAVADQRLAREGGRCSVWPDQATALRVADFIRARDLEVLAIEPLPPSSLWAVRAAPAAQEHAHAYWQHAGEVVSSRLAASSLLLLGEEVSGELVPPTAPVDISQDCRRQLAELYRVDADWLWLVSSGMAGYAAALAAARRLRPDGIALQIGFPYTDILAWQRACGMTVQHHLGEIREALQIIEAQHVAAVTVEVPGNPLLTCPDLPRLAQACRRHGCCLIVDDTLAGPCNIDILPYADMIITSATKYLNGSGDAMAGALIVNHHRGLADDLKAAVQRYQPTALAAAEAAVLASNLTSYPARISHINRNAELIASRLREHDAIDQVWYAKFDPAQMYHRLKVPGGGYGGLISFLLVDASINSQLMYDQLAMSKGPSLGTHFSLVSPYTLLAHYHELEWAESCGVSRWLIRLSVGLEDPEDLWQRLDQALDLVISGPPTVM